MAAKKGIKKKVVDWLQKNPGVQVTGRELETMYVAFGGNAYPADHPRKGLRGRVSQDTVWNFVRSIPLRKVSDGPICSSSFRQRIERATFEYSPPTVTTYPSGISFIQP